MLNPQGNNQISRRTLMQAAGGITFLALTQRSVAAIPRELEFATPIDDSGPLPVFTALPYLQPGDASQLIEGAESVVVAWQTDGVPAEYVLTYGENGFGNTAQIKHILLQAGNKEASPTAQRINYKATLSGLNLGKRYRYRVTMKGVKIVEGYLTTRKPRGAKTRFVAFGDNSYGDMSDRAIAFQAYRAMPDFVMNTGDNVYESGLDDEYARYFFPVYNADEAGPRLGAPLLRSAPFYTVIANHDLNGKDAHGHPSVDFAKHPDSLGYYTNMHLPTNGVASATPTPIFGPENRLTKFKEAAGNRFPVMANYSFDYGDAHFLCLDSNVYVDPTSATLQDWIAADLSRTDAAWKIVVYHHPAYNAGEEHYAEQQMRVLSPILEKHGVDIVLSGHEHTYQRTKPLRFSPTDVSAAKLVGSNDRLVPGIFTVDRRFDGKTVTKPDGVIYITTGAGGKNLYDPQMNSNPKNWAHEEDGNTEYVERFISDRHSLTVFDLNAKSLTMRQIDEWGREVDRMLVTKS